ncbi:MAG: hypothetical protein E6G51_02095 [Actinobacteria bacterium]|nr:MAG: hypothetical protein E6G51_02095 [Actinomycetota bacterium]
MSMEVGREEPRLFEEVLDWLLTNERLISVQRLRNLAIDDADRALVEAVLGWMGQKRRRPRLGAKAAPAERENAPQPFFRNSRLPIVEPDPAFLAQGFLKPLSEPTGKSQSPDLRLPINFAFRLRLLLGIGVRAEAVRVLLTAETPWMEVQALARSTAYTKRNVQEAVGALREAGALGSWELGNEQRLEVSRQHWADFLALGSLPQHRDWPQRFTAYRKILRWLADPTKQNLSKYMLSSEAQSLVEEVDLDLRFSGATLETGIPPSDPSYWENFAQRVRELSLL